MYSTGRDGELTETNFIQMRVKIMSTSKVQSEVKVYDTEVIRADGLNNVNETKPMEEKISCKWNDKYSYISFIQKNEYFSIPVILNLLIVADPFFGLPKQRRTLEVYAD